MAKPASRHRRPVNLRRVVVPAALFTGTVLNVLAPVGRWTEIRYLLLAFVAVAWLTAIHRDRLRNALLSTASLLLCFTALDAYCAITNPSSTDIQTPGYRVWTPIIGWGPAHPGVFHHTKLDGEGRVIFDTGYTIGPQQTRNVVSATEGPAVAFFGDSMTFGIGLPDDQTLPQLFADVTGRGFRVYNLAISGFGPQQFLRALETGLYDELLTPSRLIVYLTAPWHAERSACLRGFMFEAPRYELLDGKPHFAGICGDTWSSRLRALLSLNSVTSTFVEPLLGHAGPAAVDLYIAILARAGELAREKYGAGTVILYLRDPSYSRQAGSSDAEIMQKLRDRGLRVIDATLDSAAFPGKPLYIPGDGHPTGVANRARAELLRTHLDGLWAPTQ
jgi:hypothetical protein